MTGTTEREPASPAVLAGSLAILLSTLLWGTLWIPLRYIDAAGNGLVWTTVASFMTPLLVVIPLGLLRWRRILSGGRLLLAVGVFNAVSVALYAGAFGDLEAVHRDLLRFASLIVTTPVLQGSFLGNTNAVFAFQIARYISWNTKNPPHPGGGMPSPAR